MFKIINFTRVKKRSLYDWKCTFPPIFSPMHMLLLFIYFVYISMWFFWKWHFLLLVHWVLACSRCIESRLFNVCFFFIFRSFAVLLFPFPVVVDTAWCFCTVCCAVALTTCPLTYTCTCTPCHWHSQLWQPVPWLQAQGCWRGLGGHSEASREKDRGAGLQRLVEGDAWDLSGSPLTPASPLSEEASGQKLTIS